MSTPRTAPMLAPIIVPLLSLLSPLSELSSELESVEVGFGWLTTTDVMMMVPPVESDEVTRLVMVEGGCEVEVVAGSRLEEGVVVSSLVAGFAALVVSLVKAGTADGDFGMLAIEATVEKSGTSISSLSSQSQQVGLLGSRFLSQHQLPSGHHMMASFPAAVLSKPFSQFMQPGGDASCWTYSKCNTADSRRPKIDQYTCTAHNSSHSPGSRAHCSSTPS